MLCCVLFFFSLFCGSKSIVQQNQNVVQGTYFLLHVLEKVRIPGDSGVFNLGDSGYSNGRGGTRKIKITFPEILSFSSL